MRMSVDRGSLNGEELCKFDSMYEEALLSLKRSLGMDNDVVRESALSIASWNFEKWRREHKEKKPGPSVAEWPGWR